MRIYNSYIALAESDFTCWSIEHLEYRIRLSEIECRACKILGDRTVASRWVFSRARGLGYLAPCLLVSTNSGYYQVSALLDSIEHCIYI
ncbi:antitoxin Xre/MbcA/ParS toxin-binding domain-containing protein [Pseudomonas sp. LF-5]|uniref:antitoxin Xre/MbcA/ParS toxin-binding domain-containing protein n=1 Tax=Pseudomonas sp. LF-5 TaxID=3031121 RepID=UPI00403FAACE